MAVNYGSLPFKEAITFFRDKINLPTRAWTDIWEGMHARAFVVAGATKDELLTDMRGAVGKAIEDGTTIQQFRKDFDSIVQKHGWQYNGGRGWRTRVIYETNMRQAYNAGREKQMQDPALRKRRPYGLYKHNDAVEHPRPEHLANDNKVYPLDDVFWEYWTPQNGWGCKCKKFMLSEQEARQRGLTVEKKSPPIKWETKTVGQRGPSPRTVRVPKGIDPGFAYNPGTAAWGKQLSDNAMASFRKTGAAAWEPLNSGGPETFNRPGTIPLDKSRTKLGPRLKTQNEMADAIRQTIGSDEAVFEQRGLPVLVNADSLAKHVDPNRSEFIPLLSETLNNPYEVWLTFERHKGTGKVALRSRYIKAFELDNNKGMLMVANASRGMLEAWTFVPMSKLSELQKQRRGWMLYGRDE